MQIANLAIQSRMQQSNMCYFLSTLLPEDSYAKCYASWMGSWWNSMQISCVKARRHPCLEGIQGQAAYRSQLCHDEESTDATTCLNHPRSCCELLPWWLFDRGLIDQGPGGGRCSPLAGSGPHPSTWSRISLLQIAPRLWRREMRSEPKYLQVVIGTSRSIDYNPYQTQSKSVILI